MTETLDESAARVLSSETGLQDIYLEQLYTFSDIDRDPRMRVISTSYMALVDKDKVGQINLEAKWVNFDSVMENEDTLAFDHSKIIDMAYNRLKNKLEYSDIVFNLMPEEFTLRELQQVYEIILQKKLLDPAFRRIIANKVEGTGRYRKSGGHRPSELFIKKE